METTREREKFHKNVEIEKDKDQKINLKTAKYDNKTDKN